MGVYWLGISSNSLGKSQNRIQLGLVIKEYRVWEGGVVRFLTNMKPGFFIIMNGVSDVKFGERYVFEKIKIKIIFYFLISIPLDLPIFSVSTFISY